MTPFPAEHLSIPRVWTKGSELWRRSFTTIMPLLLVLIAWMYIPSFFLFAESINTWVFVAFLVVYILGLFFWSGAIYYRMHMMLLNEPSDNAGALKIMQQRLWKIALAIVIASLLLSAGFLLLFPGLYFLVFIWFYFPIIIFDNLDPIKALRASYKLVHNHWWETAIAVGIPFLMLLGLGFLIEHMTIGLDFTRIIFFHNSIEWYIQHLLKIILTLILLPFFIAFIVVQLENLKREYQEDFIDNLADYPMLPEENLASDNLETK